MMREMLTGIAFGDGNTSATSSEGLVAVPS